MFDKAWLENELAGLIIQLHQIEGAIAVLKQMLAQWEAAQAASPALPQLSDLLPAGVVIDGEPHEHHLHA